MGGLIPLLLFVFCLFAQAPPSPWNTLAEQGLLRALSVPPAERDSLVLKRVYQACLQLEHGPAKLVRRGWECLAQSGKASDVANLVLWRRRHGLDPAIVDPLQNVEVALECALATWGNGDLASAEIALLEALNLWPEDARLLSNLAWLRQQAQPDLILKADPRAQAHSVLFRRRALRTP